jgi:hypothetical protein
MAVTPTLESWPRTASTKTEVPKETFWLNRLKGVVVLRANVPSKSSPTQGTEPEEGDEEEEISGVV